MSDSSQGPGWWQASDGKWYAPEQHPDYQPPAPAPAPPPTAQQPPIPPGPAAPPYGAPPPGPAPAQPYGAPPPGAAPAQPYGAPPAQPYGQPMGTAYGEPPAAPGGGGGKGGKVALIVGAVVLLLAGAAGALVVAGGDDDDKASSPAPAVTTTTTKEATRRTLVERSTTTRSGAGSNDLSDAPAPEDIEAAIGADLDPAAYECLIEEMLDDPSLMDIAEADPDPSSPEFAVLLDVLVYCGARPQLEQAFIDGVSEGGIDPAASECITGRLESLTDVEFVDLIIGLAAEDPASMDVIIDCML
jgi:hypothetical protein